MIQFSTAQVAAFIGGKVDGDAETIVSSFAKIEQGKAGDLCFLANMAYEQHLYSTSASAVIVADDFKPSKAVSAALIRVKNPYEAFAKLMAFAESQKPRATGVSELAFIAQGVEIPSSCLIGEFVVVQKNAKIGENCTIYPQVFIGENAIVGNDVVLFPGVKVMNDSVIGNRCVLNAGAIIGGDGFGFAPDEKGHYNKIPQLGNVVLEDDVEIGANTTIDRATMGSTRIGQGTKLDNLIMIAHNVELGKHNVFAAQAGVSGSTKMGDHNMIGGQVGFSGHIKIGSHCKIAAQSGIMSDVPNEASLMGSPAIPSNRYFRIYAIFRKLDELARKVNSLENK